jgi:hypothetical protein
VGEAPLEQAVPVGAAVLRHLRSAAAAVAHDGGERDEQEKAIASGEIGSGGGDYRCEVDLPPPFMGCGVWKWRREARRLPGVSRGVVLMRRRRRIPESSRTCCGVRGRGWSSSLSTTTSMGRKTLERAFGYSRPIRGVGFLNNS